MAENDVYIEGGNWPDWALEQTQQGILRVAQQSNINSATSNQILSKILGALSNGNDSQYLSAMANAAKQSAQAAEDQVSEARRMTEAVEEGNEIAKDDSEQRKKESQRNSTFAFQQMSLSKQMQFMAKYRRADDKQKLRLLEGLHQEQVQSNKNLQNLASMEEKYAEANNSFFAKWGSGGYVGFQEAIEGFKEGFAGLGADIFGGDSGRSIWSRLGSVFGGLASGLGVLQGVADFGLGQIETRFDFASELRRTGMFESLAEVRESFSRIALNVNEAGFTFQEASEFTRQFSRAVGVIGVYESMKFVDTMAEARGMMDEYGMTYPEVAYMSGAYLETLERAGLLDQMNAQERERGMSSFMSAVEGTSLAMKVSFEEAAEIIKGYASREDISAIAAFNPDISQELRDAINFIGSVGGPIGEAVAMSLSTGENFVRTQEFENIYGTTAGQTIAPFFEDMVAAIRTNPSDVRGILSQFVPQMRQSMLGSDIVRMETYERDSFAASMVNSLLQLGQIASDLTLSVAPSMGGVDQAQLDMIRAERLRGVKTEEAFSNVIQDMEKSGELYRSLSARTDALKAQTEALVAATDKLSLLVSGGLSASIQLTATANELFFKSITTILGFLQTYSPGVTPDIPSSTYAERITDEVRVELDDELFGYIPHGMGPEELQEFINANRNGIFADPDALNYFVARNNELLDERMIGENYITDKFSDDVMEALSGVFDNLGTRSPTATFRTSTDDIVSGLMGELDILMTNNYTMPNAQGNLSGLTNFEITEFSQVLEEIANRQDLTKDEKEQILAGLKEQTEAARDQQRNIETRTEIDLLIATMNGLMQRIDP